jgi:hypothetical protein
MAVMVMVVLSDVVEDRLAVDRMCPAQETNQTGFAHALAA